MNLIGFTPDCTFGRGWSRLRSGREHWAWMVVVEEEEEKRRRRGEEQATNIKSNNPSLAGGEKAL